MMTGVTMLSILSSGFLLDDEVITTVKMVCLLSGLLVGGNKRDWNFIALFQKIRYIYITTCLLAFHWKIYYIFKKAARTRQNKDISIRQNHDSRQDKGISICQISILGESNMGL